MSDIVTRLWGNTGDKYPGFQNLNTEAAAEITRLREELEKAQSWSRLWYETAMEYYPPNWATDGTPKNIIGNIVRYTESREAARLVAWKAEADAIREYDTMEREPDEDIEHWFARRDIARIKIKKARAATDAIEKNVS